MEAEHVDRAAQRAAGGPAPGSAEPFERSERCRIDEIAGELVGTVIGRRLADRVARHVAMPEPRAVAARRA